MNGNADSKHGSVGDSGTGGGTEPTRTRIATPPNSGNNSNSNNNNTALTSSAITTTTSKKAAALQMQKIREANTKYKNLLKLAKERIEQQEVELQKFHGTFYVDGVCVEDLRVVYVYLCVCDLVGRGRGVLIVCQFCNTK